MDTGEGGGTTLSRRRFLRTAAMGGALVAAPGWLAACGGGEGATTATPAATGRPRRGGVLRVGVSGGGSRDTLDAHVFNTQADAARINQLYNWLVSRDHDFSLRPALATEFVPNAKGDELTVRLRDGVTFHDGRPLTADDVIFSFRRMLDPDVGALLASQLGPVLDPNDLTAVDRLTVRFRFRFPFFAFEDFVGDASAGIVPVGYDPKNPIGTGPFKLESFKSGQEAVFTRNENYWDMGADGSALPYVDKLVITNLSDDTARVNALLSGAVDAVDSIPFSLLPMIRANRSVQPLVGEGGNWYPVTMRVDRPPFDDVRVRQAFKHLVDRPQLIESAFGGEARLANDLYAIDDPLYARDIPQREQDLERARFLLKQAGRERLTVSLVTAPVQNGLVEQCLVLAEQAKAAGVDIRVSKLDSTTFYNDQFLQRTFSVDWWTTASFLAATSFTLGPTAAYNGTHYDDERFNKRYYEALATNDPARQADIAREMQRQIWDDSGLIIAGFPHNVDAYSTKLSGLVPDKTGYSLTSWRFRDVWFR